MYFGSNGEQLMLDICGVGKRMPTRRRLHLSQGFFNLTSLASGSCLYQVGGPGGGHQEGAEQNTSHTPGDPKGVCGLYFDDF